jgi:phage baseplate assembly protein W
MAKIYSDWRLNWAGRSGRIRCHQDGDLVAGPNNDWSRVSGPDYLLQKLKLYFGIPHGEVINHPEIGCCIHSYIFDRLTDETCLALQAELAYELADQLPELGVQSVQVLQDAKSSVRVQISSQAGQYVMEIDKNDLLAFSLIDSFAVKA